MEKRGSLMTLLNEVYGAVSAPDGWPGAMACMAHRFGTESSAILFADTQDRSQTLILSHGPTADEKNKRAYEEYYSFIDPVIPLAAKSRAGDVMIASEIWAPAQMRGNEFYADYFSKLGLRDCLGAILMNEPGRFAAVALHRSAGADGFERRDAVQVSAIAPHLLRALTLYQQFAKVRSERTAFADRLEYLGKGILILDRKGSVSSVTRRAEDTLTGDNGMSIGADGRVSVMPRQSRTRLDALIRGVLASVGAPAGGSVIVPRPAPRLPYTLIVSPLLNDTAFFGGRASGAMIMIDDPELGAVDAQAAIDSFGLTPTEARVLVALSEGGDLAAISRRFRVSIATTRFHLKALFAKLGAHSQADVVRIALKVLPVHKT